MFEFNCDQVALWTSHDDGADDGARDKPVEAPADLLEVIGTSGDQFRDGFTRLCLYLAVTSGHVPEERTDDTVVVGTEYGNTAALARLQRVAESKGRLLSAQYFPNATSSSASAFVNMRVGATGRNMTLNAGLLTPVIALWQALSALDRERSDRSRLLVGDVYSPEAVSDVALEDPDAVCRSAMAHAVLTRGDDLTAEFDFGASDGPVGRYVRVERLAGEPSNAEPANMEPAGAPPQRNGAFATEEFLRLVRTLRPAERAVLACRAPGGRYAGVTVTRRDGDRRRTS